MNDEPVEFFAISEAAKIKLRESDLVFAESVLCNHTVLRDSHPEDEQYLEQLKNLPPPISCLELRKLDRRLKSGSDSLDNLLGGGIKLKAITEFCGLPGSGKTQLCMQLSVMSQLPESFGGLSSRVVYIDCIYGFTTARYKGIRDKIGDRLSSKNWKSELEPLAFRARGAKELFSAIQALRSVLENNCNISTVIIDSFSRPFLFEQVLPTVMASVLTDLHDLANDFNIAVVLTSQLTSKQNTESLIKYQSVLRSGMGYYINDRIYLHTVNGKMHATYSKNLDVVKDAINIQML